MVIVGAHRALVFEEEVKGQFVSIERHSSRLDYAQVESSLRLNCSITVYSAISKRSASQCAQSFKTRPSTQKVEIESAKSRLKNWDAISHFKWGIPINVYVDWVAATPAVTRETPAILRGLSNLLRGLALLGLALLIIILVLRLFRRRVVEGELERDDPSSERVVEVDYTRLENLLEAGKWKEADQETLTVMLKVAGRGWLDAESIKKFPCTDLRTIDTLWVKYSNGHFGFSVQKKIWQSVGGQPGKYDLGIYKKFAERVGWLKLGRRQLMQLGKKEENWVSYSEITFSINAPQGHLPGVIINNGFRDIRETELWYQLYLFSRA